MTWDDLFEAQANKVWAELAGDAEIFVDVEGQLLSTRDAFVDDQGRIIIKTGD
jgi:hypothetical protein